MDKRLFRNEHEKVIAGVSSGIAEYMEVDVTIIRLLFVLSTFFLVGTGILVYIVMWIIVPVNNDPASRFTWFNAQNPFFTQANATENTNTEPSWTSSTINEGDFKSAKKPDDFKPFQKNNGTGRTVGGLFLLVIGLYFLMNEFDIIPFWFSIRKLWPLVFVAIGASFLLKSKTNSAWEEWKRENNPANPVTGKDVPDHKDDEPAKTEDRFTKKEG